MKRKDYFLAAMNDGCYRHRGWVHDAFSFQEPLDEMPKVDYPWVLWRDSQGYHIFNQIEGKAEFLEGAPSEDEEAFNFRDEIVLKKGEVPNLEEGITTTYGDVLINYCTLVYATGNKIPFQSGVIKAGKLEHLFYHMKDEPGENDKRDGKTIYVDEYLRFQDGVRYLEEFADLCVPSATPFNVMTDPAMAKKREELFAKYKDQLDDPVVEAKINEELVQLDKDWVNKDPEKGFYQKEKSFQVARKKLYLMQGTESGFGNNSGSDIIKNSLEEGWNIDYLPEMNNSLRNGSFSRGAQTALAGEIVKTLLRITQNTSITEEDCGVKFGLLVDITKDNASRYIDRYYINSAKKPIYIDEAVANSLVGKTVEIRSPWSCQTEGYNVCRACMGKEMGETPKAIGVYVSDVGSSLLLTFLKLMHGVTIRAVRYELKDRIS